MLFSTSATSRAGGKPSREDRANSGSLVARETGREISFTLKPLPGESIIEIFARLANALKEFDATPLHVMVFGSVAASVAGNEAVRRIFGALDWPVTWIEGESCDDHPIAGVQVFALTGCSMERIELDGHVVGSVFENENARHCILGGLGPKPKLSTRGDETISTLERLQAALDRAGFSLADVIRTWFFLDDILGWYDEFNRARTQIYSGLKFHTNSLPASTGVGARNSAGAAVALAAWAVQPLGNASVAEEIASPMQCPAPAYGSSFSRAMEHSTASGRRLFISGTATWLRRFYFRADLLLMI
jgi:enamine deaminase RidA (YjgF/YER057c/UK114 family)